jgi:hypothetical protein
VSRTISRGRWATLAIVIAVAAGAVSAWRAGALAPAASSRSGPPGPPPPATQPVVREDLSAVTPVSATLGYEGSYLVRGTSEGTLTWLPAPGAVIRQGRVLYRINNGSPVVLLYGRVPAWRALGEGMIGADVAQLNHDLVRLRLADRAEVAGLGWDYFSWATAYGVQRLEERRGVADPPGSLSLGQVVFEPDALRVSRLTGSLGGSATGPVVLATSDRQAVTIGLDASDQSEVRLGDRVSITLPSGATTPGVVSSVGRVATGSGSGSGSGGGSGPTIPVQVRLAHPRAAGSLDQAPVTVDITTASVRDALAVPVGALLAQAKGAGEAGGGYDVEVAGPGGVRRWVPVRPGLFDDADGLVQVTGALTPGQRVVVPAT